MVLYTASNEKLVLKFDAHATNNNNWFDAEKLQESPWQDILKSFKNFFSIAGWCNAPGHCRTFFINRQYGGCAVDAGWLMIGGIIDGGCAWESRFSGNSFQYSNIGTFVPWSKYGRVFLLRYRLLATISSLSAYRGNLLSIVLCESVNLIQKSINLIL